MKGNSRWKWVAWLGVLGWAVAQAGAETAPVATMQERLDAALAELAAVRQRIAEERVPLARELVTLDQEFLQVRQEYEALRRKLDQQALEKSRQVQENRRLEQEQTYLFNLLAEYARNFEVRLHIAELRRHEKILTLAKTAADQSELDALRRFARQWAVAEAAGARVEELLGGTRFEGRAAGEDGLVVPGRFVLLGPVAYFAADAAPLAGIAEQRLGSLEPTVSPPAQPEFTRMIREFVAKGEGLVPFDASLGNARKIEQTRETLVEHIRKGGAVMIPILGMASLIALLILVKGLSLSLARLPSPARLHLLLQAVRQGNLAAARAEVAKLRGPAGEMLQAGVQALGGSKDLIEEAMYERLMGIRFRLNRGLPFIAVGAATAPLLGLLGTVTGIISTFKLITVFGSGDVKMLSSGISEALITTEFGLLVAIPSLLSHAFLTRKARAMHDRLEQMAVMFMGAVAAAPGITEATRSIVNAEASLESPTEVVTA